MTNFSVAVNSDGRGEAFFIDDNGTVMHTWQITAQNNQVWQSPVTLFGDGGQALTDAVSLGAGADVHGKIQVVAVTSDGNYHLCYQTQDGPWQGWVDITQQ